MLNSRPKHPRNTEYRDLLTGVTSFKELEARISSLKTPEERGHAFEVFCEAFLVTQDLIEPDNLWPVPEKTAPITLQERLAMPRKDYGIDGIYAKNGIDAGYQIKFRTGRGTLSYGDDKLSNFCDQVERVKAYGIKHILTNAEDVVEEVHRDRAGFVLTRGSDFDKLTPED